MGADVYLRSEYEPHVAKVRPKFEKAVAERDKHPSGSKAHEAAQKRVEKYFGEMRAKGYFRDPYNPTGFSSLVGFSWWQDIIPMLDDEGFLPVAKAKEFLLMLQSKPVTEQAVRERMTPEWKQPFEEVLAYYQKDHADLCALLQRSIDLNEPLECSL